MRRSELVYRMESLTALGITVFTIAGCAPKVQAEQRSLPYNLADCTNPDGFPPYTENPNSIIHAATASVFYKANVNNYGYGRAFLYMDDQRHLNIGTVDHVAASATQFCLYVNVPGSGASTALDYRTVIHMGHKVSGTPFGPTPIDDIVSFPVTGEYFELLSQAMQRGELTPLQIASKAAQAGDRVAIPNPETGKVAYLTVIDNINNLITMQSEVGAVCQGRSGTSVLATKDGLVTNQVVGATVSISKNDNHLYLDNQNRYCNDNIIMAINAVGQ